MDCFVEWIEMDVMEGSGAREGDKGSRKISDNETIISHNNTTVKNKYMYNYMSLLFRKH